MIKTDTKRDKVFIIFCYIFVALLVIITFYPFWDLFILSISPRSEALKPGLRLFTSAPTLQAYETVFKSNEIIRSFWNSLVRVVVGTVFSLGVTALTCFVI